MHSNAIIFCEKCPSIEANKTKNRATHHTADLSQKITPKLLKMMPGAYQAYKFDKGNFC